jgi:hypothetical protein
MAERLDYPLMLAVDNCVEQLLAGRDWRSQLPADHTRGEVAALVELAERLLRTSDGDGVVRSPGVRIRVWQKLTRAVHRSSIHLAPKTDIPPWALRIGAPPPAFRIPASGGACTALV